MKKIFFLLIVFFISSVILAKMPGWKFFKDREGNSYYLNQAGKIFVTGNRKFKYKALSSAGALFSYNNALDLIKRGFHSEGLQILKSILALPSKNQRLINIQIKSSDLIKKLKSKNGSRFKRINENASILLFKYNDDIYLNNDRMFYRIKLPGNIAILSVKRRFQRKKLYSGITLGIKFSEDKSGSNYDMLLAIDSERLTYKFNNINELIENWSINLGDEKLKRKVIVKEKKLIIKSFISEVIPFYSGFELSSFNYKFSYFVRIITSKKKYKKYNKIMLETLKSFSPVKIKNYPL